MTPDLPEVEAELSLAYRKSVRDLLFAFFPFLMALAATLGLKKQRDAVRAAMTEVNAADDFPAPAPAPELSPAQQDALTRLRRLAPEFMFVPDPRADTFDVLDRAGAVIQSNAPGLAGLARDDAAARWVKRWLPDVHAK